MEDAEAPETKLTALMQFIKYAIVGAAATGVNAFAFFAAACAIFPCLTADDRLFTLFSKFFDLTLPEMSDSQRSLNALYCNLVAFVISNAFCYVLNRLFVFKPGRHGMAVEAFLFFAVSGLSFAVGSAGQTALIALCGLPTSLAFGAFLVASIIFNFILRKFFVFKG